MENFGKFMVIILAIVISPIVNGFVILKLWGWFVVPIFGMQPLRLIEAIGLMFLINYLIAKRNKEAEKEKFWDTFVVEMIFLILYSALALFGGWIVSLCI